jgi:hypothetical protein
MSVLDPAWMDAVDPVAGVFVVAQGLLMYLEPDAVRVLFTGIADRFRGAEVVFDVVPRWFSALTRLGLMGTPNYRLPPMPWGIDRNEIEATLLRWHPSVARVDFLDYGVPRGVPLFMARLIAVIPIVRHEVPSLVHVTIASASSQPVAGPRTGAGGKPAPESTSEGPSLRVEVPTPFRGRQMPSIKNDVPETHTIDGLIAAVTRNTGRGGDVATATHQVVAKRVALGMAAALDPLSADHGEFAQIIPEKLEAFSSASMIMIERVNQASHQLARLASDELAAVARAAIAMAGHSSPTDLADAQCGFALAWFNRAASSFFSMGMLALDAQDAAMAPIRHTVEANAERLNR